MRVKTERGQEMKLTLSPKEIIKVLSNMSIETIEERLDANYSYWDVYENEGYFELNTKQEGVKK